MRGGVTIDTIQVYKGGLSDQIDLNFQFLVFPFSRIINEGNTITGCARSYDTTECLADTIESRAFFSVVTSSLFQARRVKRLHGQSKHLLEKEESNKIYHGPAYKKALTDEEFAQKKARYYKKLRLGHRGEHRPANTRHDQDDLSLQDLSVQQDKPYPSPSTVKHKKINYNKASSSYQSGALSKLEIVLPYYAGAKAKAHTLKRFIRELASVTSESRSLIAPLCNFLTYHS